MDTSVELPLVFITTETIDERCLAAIRDLIASGEDVPIVVFYFSYDPKQEALALEAGADDCIGLALDFGYLEARLRATVARLRRNPRSREPAPRIVVNPLTHGILVNSCSISVSPLQFRLLLELQRARGKVVPYDQLEMILWGEAGASSHQSLKQLAHRLRSRLGDVPDAIGSIPGVGYILR